MTENISPIMLSPEEIQQRLGELEKKYDKKFNVVFEAIRQLMAPPESSKKRPIGFRSWTEN